MKRALIAGSLIALVFGIALGLMPQSAQGYQCGSVFWSSADALGVVACDDRRGLFRPVVWTLVGVGGLGLFIGVMIGDVRRPQDAP